MELKGVEKNERLGIVSFSSFHFILPCFIMKTDQGFRSVSFVMKQKWVCKKKKLSVSSFHFVSPCFVTSTDQGCRSV